MDERCGVLAAVDGLGKVYDCGNCGSIHLQIGMVNLTLTPEIYLQLVAMLVSSAANFEAWTRDRQVAEQGSVQTELIQ